MGPNLPGELGGILAPARFAIILTGERTIHPARDLDGQLDRVAAAVSILLGEDVKAYIITAEPSEALSDGVVGRAHVLGGRTAIYSGMSAATEALFSITESEETWRDVLDAEALRATRKQANLSQTGLADKVRQAGELLGEPNRCTKRLVQKWESGYHATARPAYRRALVRALHVNYKKLFKKPDLTASDAPEADGR